MQTFWKPKSESVIADDGGLNLKGR